MASGGTGSRAESPVTTLSSRAGSQRSNTAGPPSTSHLESTITRLLVATKQLLEGLARWSRREVDENAISEIYVKLGNDFNVACAAFAREGITMNELLSVPADLRVCLETCLSDQPSQATLERHLPQVRQIIIGLLHGLREKQRLYREGVAARRQRDARAAATAAGGNVTQQLPAGPTLTPTSANRSRDELRRFVTQTQQAQGPSQGGPTASTSSSSVGANEPPRGSDGGAPTRRSTSDQGLPSGTSSSSASAHVQGEARFSTTAMSTRSSAGTGAGSLRSSGSIRDSTRSSTSTQSQSRPALEDAFGPVHAPLPPPSNSRGTMTRSASSASLETQPIAAPTQVGRPGLERSATMTMTTGRQNMMSPPPPPRRRGQQEEEEPMPGRTSTQETFGGGPIPAGSSSSSSGPYPFARHPSAGSIRSLTDDSSAPPTNSHLQAVSLEALRADNLSRRASKRYSAYAIQKMTSPNTAAGAGDAAGGGGLSPSPSALSNGFGGGGMGEERNARGGGGSGGGKAGASSSAGRELAGVDAPRRSKSEHHASSSLSSSRPSGHRSTGSSTSSRRDAVPPLPPIPRSYAAASNGGMPASPIVEEDQQQQERAMEVRSPPPPTIPLPSVPASTTSSSNTGVPSAPPPQRSDSTSSLSRSETQPARAVSPSVSSQHQISPTTIVAPSGLTGSVASFSASEPEYPCSIFLQIGRNVKKARLSSPPELATLRQLFVERFGYNPGLAEWPDIYLRDADSGVHYELEEMSEIRAGSVLSLNVDTVEQVKTHIDHGLSALAEEIKELRATVSAIRPTASSTNALLSPSHRDSVMSGSGMSPSMRPSPSERDFQHAAKRVLRSQTPSRVPSTVDPDRSAPNHAGDVEKGSEAPLAEDAAPNEEVAEHAQDLPATPNTSVAPVVDMLKSQHADVQTLRREIGVLRQVYADWTTQTKEMFASVRVQTSHVQHLAKTKLSTDRTFVEAGTARLDTESTDLVVKVDELQDSIEQLRSDTVRGVKPRPQTLSETATALRKAVEARQKLSEWLKEVKPTWSQMWSNELGKILGEQKTVEQQETLLGELDEDLEDAAKVFKNIQAVAKQLKTPGIGVKPRERDYGGTDNAQEGLSTVLMEVKALSPDPTKRLEAIERAEKQRQAELASRTDEFAEELGDFVGKGRLKKSGGIEETERIRQARSEATLRNMFQS
ncbi:hypothetical protein JCM10908_003261 [Rhodotorula pacifica]|uniref:formin-mediated actin nucleation enhancer n=1 Tax=Rhodotorula pacifica TaxID=1495444 RepID=UPI00316ECD3D